MNAEQDLLWRQYSLNNAYKIKDITNILMKLL